MCRQRRLNVADSVVLEVVYFLRIYIICILLHNARVEEIIKGRGFQITMIRMQSCRDLSAIAKIVF